MVRDGEVASASGKAMNLRGRYGKLAFFLLLVAAATTWKFTSISGAASINGVILIVAARLWRYVNPRQDLPAGLDDPDGHITLNLRS
jgi:hypothetical protein